MNRQSARMLRLAKLFLVAAVVVNPTAWYLLLNSQRLMWWHQPMIDAGGILLLGALVLWLVNRLLQVRHGLVIDAFPGTHVPGPRRTGYYLVLMDTGGRTGTIKVRKKTYDSYKSRHGAYY